ncbi:MAG: UDP-N-acetylmuramoyl-tripeptide--D-alanyl-D-alanine ligase, partial [Candidatus Paceibacterota bacterium]
LGDSSEEEHLAIINLCEKLNNIKQIVFVGEHFYLHKKEDDQFLFFKTTHESKEWFKKFEKGNHQFLLKGSRGMKMEELIKD